MEQNLAYIVIGVLLAVIVAVLLHSPTVWAGRIFRAFRAERAALPHETAAAVSGKEVNRGGQDIAFEFAGQAWRYTPKHPHLPDSAECYIRPNAAGNGNIIITRAGGKEWVAREHCGGEAKVLGGGRSPRKLFKQVRTH